MKLYKNLINSTDFAYLIGNFMADGCLYIKNKKYLTFEFYDGSSINNELKYSSKHIDKIRKIVLKYFKVNTYKKLRDKRYILYFQSKELAHILNRYYKLKPGKKAGIVDLPNRYKNNRLEKFFWQGFMDGDGMVARNSRKVALEVKSKNLIISFKDFLTRNNIKCKYSERKLNNTMYFRINILSAFVNDYNNLVGFSHPRKKMWIKRHISKGEHYKNNSIDYGKVYQNNKLNFIRLFVNSNAYVVDGIELLNKYNIPHKGRKNVSFEKLYELLVSKGLSNKKINKELSKFMWKMGKGSKNSLMLPYVFNKSLNDIAKIIRVKNYGILISRNYAKALDINYHESILNINKMFNIQPFYTCKGEPEYAHGVIGLFFKQVITPNN